MVKQKSVQNQPVKLQATDDPWKHQVAHVSLSPAEGDIGKDLGDMGKEENRCAHLESFWGVLQCFTQQPVALFHLWCFYAFCIYSTSCL